MSSGLKMLPVTPAQLRVLQQVMNYCEAGEAFDPMGDLGNVNRQAFDRLQAKVDALAAGKPLPGEPVLCRCGARATRITVRGPRCDAHLAEARP